MQGLPSEVKIGAPPSVEITGASRALEYARKIVVTDQSGYTIAAQELQDIKARANRIEDARVKLKEPIIAAGRSIDAFFKEALVPLQEAETVIKGAMLTYQRKEAEKIEAARRQQEEEARAARVAAEREARAAREKAETEARRQREEAAAKQREADAAEARARAAREAGDREAAARAERERKVAEDDQRKAQERAEKATEKGDARAAQVMAEAAQIAARPAPVAEAPVAAGVSIRSNWKHRVDDLMKLVQSVAAGKTPITAIMANDKALGQAAKSLRGELSKFYPGVEAIEEKGLAAKSG